MGLGCRQPPHLQRTFLSPTPAFSLNSPKTGHKARPPRGQIYESHRYTQVYLQARRPTTAFPFYLVRRSKLFPNHIYTSLINQTLWSASREGRLREPGWGDPVQGAGLHAGSVVHPGTHHGSQGCADGGKERCSLWAPRD